MMIEEQLKSRGIEDERVIRAMRETPRHCFVPGPYEEKAYEDGPLPIGEGQTISQPYIVALMTQLLSLKGDEKVLEVGTGSGYQAAILAQLAGPVYSMEVVESLARTAKERLNELGYEVYVKCGDGYEGWPEEAPFDRVILTAAPGELPKELFRQLSLGGRMVLPVGRDLQKLKVVDKGMDETLQSKTITTVRFVPMIKRSK